MIEIWRDIVGNEGLYKVSNFGNVKSYHKNKVRILKPISVGNYLGIQLVNGRENRKFYIHRLVAQAFVENTYNKKEVNHIDGNKFNNVVTNLEWVTRTENEFHARKIGLKNQMGENNPMCKFSDETVKEIRNLYKTGKYKQSELADIFHISRMQINRIVRNLLRKEVI
jgi:predicted XRE-type DNA-binding protein